ncbi:MAG: hypothetical protein HY699_02850 [Deltaproteobacteria bacterium]|nr:hypothetical protein [Deltaproteobacteria bacterium]
MAAVTLGFEEIEQRLQAVRRRVNLFAAQQLVYLGLSVVALASAALLVAALHGSSPVFRLVFWLSLAVIGAVLAGGPWLLWRRWYDLPAIAALIDRRAALQDRLATLLAARARRRPARLAGLLLADTLALAARWEPRVLSPRRIPRSAYLLLAALLLPTTSALISRPAAPTADKASLTRTATTAAPAGAPSFTDQAPATASLAAQTAAAAAPEAAGSAAHFAGQSAAGDRHALADSGPGPEDLAGTDPTGAEPDLAERLRQLLRAQFHADPLPRNSDGLLPRRQPRGGDAPDTPGLAARAQPGREAAGSGLRAQPQPPGALAKADPEPRRGAQDRPGGAPQAAGANSAAGTGAGAGSAGAGGLLVKDEGAAAPAGDGPRTFKVTLTSFLHGLAAKPAESARAPRARVTGEGATASARTLPALNPQQASDDVLRKAEIPPAYEEIVRRVFSQRPGP